MTGRRAMLAPPEGGAMKAYLLVFSTVFLAELG